MVRGYSQQSDAAHLLTVEHVTSLRSLFELQDAEHTGSLSSAQLLQLLHACGETHLGEADVQAMLKDISKGHIALTIRKLSASHDNAQCTFESFLHLITQPFHPTFDPPQPHSTEPVLSSAMARALHDAFRVMDGDNDGRLNNEDVWEALMSVGHKVEVDEAEAMVAAIDTSNRQMKKGQVKSISKKDFVRVMTAQ